MGADIPPVSESHLSTICEHAFSYRQYNFGASAVLHRSRKELIIINLYFYIVQADFRGLNESPGRQRLVPAGFTAAVETHVRW
jgi:hypothetical protein